MRLLPRVNGIAQPEGPPSQAFVVASYAVVLLLTVLLTLWGAFLVPLRVAGELVPVSWLVVGLGNAGVVWAGGRLAGSRGAAVPALLWLALALLLAGQRAEGDLVVPATYVGLGYLLVGGLAAAATYGGTARARAAERAAPGPSSGRSSAPASPPRRARR